MGKGLTRLFSIQSLNSLAYSGGQLCAGVHFVYGISNVGFYHRWLVSLAWVKDIRERACKQSSQLLKVRWQILKSK
jgi:hypothetical protein